MIKIEKKTVKSKTGRGGARAGAGRKRGKIGQAKLTLAEQAREYAPEALKALADIVGDKNAPPSARVAAANALIDRGYGRPVQQLEHKGDNSAPLTVNVIGVAVAASASANNIEEKNDDTYSITAIAPK